jgi:hypothetical protein
MKKLAELANVRARWLKFVTFDTQIGQVMDLGLKSCNREGILR